MAWPTCRGVVTLQASSAASTAEQSITPREHGYVRLLQRVREVVEG
jgi:hypothetical protein